MSLYYEDYGLWRYRKKLEASRRAIKLLERPDLLIWDSETTSIDDPRCIALAAIDRAGRVVFNALFDPQEPIPPKATEIHGITDDQVVGKPTFAALASQVGDLLRSHTSSGYNVDFDQNRVLHGEFSRMGQSIYRYVDAYIVPDCIMEIYAQWWGVFSERHGSFTWQKLVEACKRFGIEVSDPPHSALGDCRRALAVLERMAHWYEVERIK